MTAAELLPQIARRDPSRSEATLQADIRQLILSAPLSLTAEDLVTADLETPVGVRRRIDIEVGSCLVEVKRDLTTGTVLPEAILQLTGYLATRQQETGCRYVGILTDGTDWLEWHEDNLTSFRQKGVTQFASRLGHASIIPRAAFHGAGLVTIGAGGVLQDREWVGGGTGRRQPAQRPRSVCPRVPARAAYVPALAPPRRPPARRVSPRRPPRWPFRAQRVSPRWPPALAPRSRRPA